MSQAAPNLKPGPETPASQAKLAGQASKSWRPILLSFLTHFFLVLLLVLLGFSAGNSSPEGDLRRAGIVLSSTNAEKETEYLNETDLAEESQEDAESETAESAVAPPPAAPALSNPVSAEIPDLPGLESIEPNQFDANQMADATNKVDTSSQYELSEEDLKLIAADQRLIQSRKPVGEPATLSVFGAGGLKGRSFVFVIDRSQSMGAQGLGVIQAAHRELTAAINQLEPHHKFQIVAYHERTVTVSKRKMLNATPENKKLVPVFIRNLAAFGGTNHENGLIAAIVFKPDVIVLMTDGGYPELNDWKIAELNRMSKKGSSIHCIQFGVGSLQQQINFMTKLSTKTSGSFRYVDVMKWRDKEK